jgi:hypothetical protein
VTEIQLAPRDDTDALAARFAARGRVQVPDVLRPADAQRLHDALVSGAPWNLFIIHDGPKVMPLAQWQAMSAGERQSVEQGIAIAARDCFEARFLNLPLTETGEPYPGLIPELEALVRFVNSAPFLDFMRAVTGQAHIAFADCQATTYRAGDFLHRHSDEVPGKNRIAAYVLGLTPRWRPEWGGLLSFVAPDGQIAEAWTPAFNTLNLLRVPQDHFVSEVASFVDSPRLAATGWLRHR